mgnify:FL=1
MTDYLASTRSELSKIGKWRRDRMTEFEESVPEIVEHANAAFLKAANFPREFRQLTTPYMQMSAKLPRAWLFWGQR